MSGKFRTLNVRIILILRETFLSIGCAQDDSKNSQIKDVPISTFESPFLTTPTTTPKYIRLQRRALATRDSCPIPPQPANGVWSLHYCRDYNDACNLDKRVELAPGTLLKYSCDTGYKLGGDPLVLCEGKENWSHVPVCIQVQCDSLNSPSTTVSKCFRLGRWVDCNAPLLQGTRATVSCRPGYLRAMSPTTIQSETVECNMDGKWEPNPIECVPVCGVATTSANKTGFPWHASVYRDLDGSQQNMRYDCEGTVVRNNLVLTAASCVWDEWLADPETVFVVTGHRFQDWNHPLNDPKIVRKSGVKNIHMNCDHRMEGGVADLVLIELKELLEFSSTLVPACLDDHSSGEEVLGPDASGSIADFGLTAVGDTTISNDILSIKTIPYVPYSQCKTFDKSTFGYQSLTSDKFCAGSFERSFVCVHNRGGGYMLKKNDLWYVMGVLSDVGSWESIDGEASCVNFTLFVNVSQHTAWIQEVMFNLDHYESHPPCEGARIWPSATTTTALPTINETLRIDDGPSCLAPPQPANGKWRTQQSLCSDGADCNIVQGAPMRPGTHLTYSCDPGFIANGITEVYCGFSGNWSAIPLCTEVKCDSPNSVSTMASCYSPSIEWVDCASSLHPGTRAEISCHPGYRKDTAVSTFRKQTVRCSETGEWTPDPIKCVPVCGVANAHQTPFIINGTSAELGDFPWHATLYMQKGSSKAVTTKFICGATIIQANFLLTAAHCVFDETTKTTVDPEKLFVMTGNIFRDYDSPFNNPLTVRKSAVRNVYKPCEYYGLIGNYASDIALLELQTPFDFSNILLPACLDLDGDSNQILEPGVSGKVAGFGRTETGESSGVLQTLSLPYISFSQCKTSKKDDRNDVFISKDKFCAGYTNGSAVCEGDSGGGLVFRKSDLWYVLGIVSVGLGVDIDNGERTCDRYSYSLYTKVSEHMTWIQNVMFQRAEGNPYPPCVVH